MTISEIINKVKWCIDHETHEDAKLADNGEDSYMDNIIRAKINDARRWLAVVSGQCESLSSEKQELTVQQYDGVENFNDVGLVTLLSGISPTSISRVRMNGWHKAAIPVDDTDNDASIMFDETARGNVERPLATVLQGTPIRILIQPFSKGENVELSYIGVGSDIDTESDENDVSIASTLQAAFIYYIAYLLLTAYQDARAQSMLAVAMQMVGNKQQ